LQDYVVQKLKISQPAYSKIELGETKIDNDKIKDTSKMLEVNLCRITKKLIIFYFLITAYRQ